MTIHLTNEASARLLGINPAVYTDKELKSLTLLSADAERLMEQFDSESDEYASAFVIKYNADQMYDERFRSIAKVEAANE